MRFVDRATVPEPSSLAAVDGDGASELALARTYYGRVPMPKKCYDFAAYKGDDVKLALHRLFKGKCAYCETPYQASQPVDVEHYRPKGQLEDDPHHPGYWWLAARWDNLLPSCIDCNRRRGQVTATLGMTLQDLETALACGDTEPLGKRDAFPTRDRVWARAEADDVGEEKPLLIDPTRIDPASHIVWALESEISMVVPVVDDGGSQSDQGVASIHVYGLNRMGLVQERTNLLRELSQRAARIEKLIDVAEESGGELTDKLHLLVDGLVSDMVAMTGSDRRYSALASAFVERFKSKLVAQLS